MVYQVSKLAIKTAGKFLSSGAVIAYPTEAVWGLGCDPQNFQAVDRILRLKCRSVDKGLILVVSCFSQVEQLCRHLTQQQRERLNAETNRPTTWLIPDPQNTFPYWIKGRYESVAVRCIKHPLVEALCENFGAIVSTSANNSSGREIRSRLNIQKQYSETLDYILPGRVGVHSKPSQICDLVSGQVIR
ncbi:MAG: tRNA threonylcarbamoyladenosine biosynthesis protein RimN [SAR86 cluster bacterium]|uniref:Threonylcarbamoyl-AMP synthase n=1 Tax=SAR86 cluster bacterium TaxID=2030880 RepID=A0A2A4MSA6_9GAMM|nr:MAG: tRNA threonylcarbamoyladenosine biosynthesis protein RimN [SAR86 cluster bacterium]